MDARRNPGLSGILQWSLAQGSDGTGAPPPTSEADRAWLAAAMQSMTVDEAARMRDLGACLRETVAHPVSASALATAGAAGASPAALLVLPGASAAEASLGAYKLAALEELQDLVESIDNAKDLFMVGAVGPLFDAVRGAPPDLGEGGAVTLRGTTPLAVRAQACLVVGTVVQNNPAAQEWALRAGALPLLLEALAAGDGETREALALRAAAMGALASLLRDCKRAQAALLVGTGMAALFAPVAQWSAFCAGGGGGGGEAARVAGRKTVRRALALLRHLASGTQPEAALAALLAAPGALPALAGVLQGGLPAGAEPELSDALDARAAAVGCLLALAAPAESLSAGVDDLQDSRAPRGLFDGKPAEGGGSGGGGGGSGDGGLGTLAIGSGGGGGSPVAYVPAALSLQSRRAALKAAGVPALLESHAQWCDARERLCGDAGDGGLAEAYAEEAATARAAAAAAASPA